VSKENYGVHIAHCCYIHGCKYGDENCPVVSGEVAQKHLCYDCEEEYEPYTLEEIELLRKTKSYRPTYKQLKEKIADLEAKLAESFTEKDVEGLIKDREETIKFLKQQLTEKEKEIKILKNMKADEMALKVIQKSNQDKISFAVSELERAKIEFETYYADRLNEYPEYLEDRIMQLKEGK